MRITVDCIKDQFSLGHRVTPHFWTGPKGNKMVDPKAPQAGASNKAMRDCQTDLKRHYDLVKAIHEIATPTLVIESYKAPMMGKKLEEEKIEALAYRDAVRALSLKFTIYDKKIQHIKDNGTRLSPERQKLLDQELNSIRKAVRELAKMQIDLFERTKRVKTIMLAFSEHMFNFLELAVIGQRTGSR